MSRWVRAELHCHTTRSHDGHISPERLVRTARRVGLDVLAVTDHDTMNGAFEVRAHAAKVAPDLQVILGEERTLADKTHLIGLFLRAPLTSSTLADGVREIHEQGGLAFLPHPFRRDGGLRGGGDLPADVAFEVFNPKCSFDENARARALAGERCVVVGGSDAHFAADLGECVNEFPFEGDLRASLGAVFAGRAPVRVLGVPQRSGQSGRKYAPWYYKVKPWVRVPRPLLPAAYAAYRRWWDLWGRVRPRPVEEKYARG